jgi:transcriptional regulator with XRE-family HTH domain
MSSKKQAAELTANLGKLRNALDVDKGQFAELLNVSRTAIQYWENDRTQPSAEAYVRLAKLAQEKSPSLAVWFWGRAGLDESALRVLAPELEKSFGQYEKRLKELMPLDLNASAEFEFVRLPLLEGNFARGDHDSVTSQIHSRIRSGADTYVPFLSTAVPRPQASVCLRAPDDYMRPIFREGDVVAVDISSGGIVAPVGSFKLWKEFHGQNFPVLVAAYYRPQKRGAKYNVRAGLHVRGMWISGVGHAADWTNIHLGTEVGDEIARMPAELRRLRGDLPKSEIWPWTELEEKESQTVIITRDPQWSILGRVVAWIGSDQTDSERTDSELDLTTKKK